MAGLERIVLWFLALLLGTVGMVRYFVPEEEPGPVFLPAQTVISTQEKPAALPQRVPGTSLQIQALVQYEGPFWEDGTGAYVSNVAALMLSNPTEKGIAYGQVFLTLEGQGYVFEFTYLPAGGRLLVPEKNRLPYLRGTVTDCWCGELVTGKFGSDTAEIRLTQSGMAGILLENSGERDLKNVCLYYKLYQKDVDAYVGGTTYQMTVGSLPAGGKQEIIPEHFVWGYSAVVDIQVGEE